MTDQPTKNLAFELWQTNQSLEAIAMVLLTLTPSDSASEDVICKHLDLVRSRIKRLDYLRK